MIDASMPPVARRAAWLGLLALLCAACFSDGAHHADEHYQILEFAGWKLGITPEADLPWEFAERMRPALQPAMAVVVHHALSVFGEPDPFVLAMLLRMLAAMLTFLAALHLLRGQLRDSPALQDEGWLKLYLFLAFFLWFVVYFGVRFSSEGFSAALFALGYAGVVHRRSVVRARPLLIAGLLLGLSVVVRFQTGLMVAGLAAWCVFIARMRWSATAFMVAGGFIGLGAGVLVDRWFYGEWALTVLNYIDLNVLQDKAAAFGTQPWWYYFAVLFERAVPPFSLLYLVSPLVLFAMRRRDALTWTVLPFLLGHVLIGHKEYRFLCPVLPLLPAMVVGGLHAMAMRGWFGGLKERARYLLRTAFLAVHVPLLLVVLFKPAQDNIGLYREIHRTIRPGDVLLHDDEDPYRQGDPIWFYRPRGLLLRSVNATGEPHDGRMLFVSRRPGFHGPIGYRTRLLYSSLPEWLLRFNVGGWADRTAVWRIWLVEG